MASTFTTLGIEKMATGENAGTWGDKTNTNLDIVNTAVSGYVEQAVTNGGTLALSITDGASTATAQNAVIKLTGTITGNSIVTVPDSVEKVYIVTNGTSGAYTVQFKTASGTGVTFGVSEKTTKLLYSDGTNIVDAGFSGALDIEGRELILDADGDTTITADTDDQIDIKIAGADDFQFTANTFTAQAGSTIAAQALTATTFTASGIVKTDDTTEATSTTDGSLQTDGGLSVAKDAVIGDDLKLLSDSAVLSFGADSDTTLTHTDGTGLTLNSTNKLLFRDTGLYINSSTDGQLDIVADTEIQIAATTIDINGAIAMDGAITGATNITLSGELDAATLDISGNADIDGTTNLDAVDIDGAVQLDATFTVGADDQGYDVKLFGDTASAYMLWDTSADDLILGGAAGLIVPDGQFTLGSTAVTSTAAEINLIDGGTARGTTAVADGDGLLVNDAGTMRMTNVTTLKTYFQTGVTASSIAADDIGTGDGAVTIATSSGNITIDAQAGDADIIFKGTDSAADITALTLDMSAAGLAIFNDSVTVGDNLNLTTDSAVINFGADSDTTLTHTDGTGLTLNSTNKLCFNDTGTYINSNADGDLDIVSDGTAQESIKLTSAGGMRIDANSTSIGIILDSAYGEISLSKAATSFASFFNLSSGLRIRSTTSNADMTFAGVDGGASITALTLDMSEAGAATFNNAITSGAVITSGAGVVVADAGTIGSASDTDAIAIGADGDITLTQDLELQHDGAILSFGANDEVTLTHVHNDGLLLNTDMQLQFRDSAINIRSDADGDLDINADDEVEINSTLIDINGNVEMSGTLTQSGVATFSVAANVAQVAITSSSNAIAWDASAAANAYHITTENTTFSAPSNAVEGAFIAVEINYNGSHTIAFNTVFEFAASTAPTTTDTDGKTDILVFRYNGAVWQEVGRTLNLAES